MKKFKDNKELDIILNIEDLEEKYSLIYDYLCDYLDNDMNINNYCDFIDGKCIASRKGKAVHEIDGCCWQRGVGHCHHLTKEGNCPIRCVSCKLFMCSYMENRGIKYKPHKILPLRKLLNRKQMNIIKRSYFKSKEEIIELLLEAV